jgi:hypothetical protein
MGTQAIISMVKNDHTFIKIICGCGGYNAEKLVKVLKDNKSGNIKTGTDLLKLYYIMALENGFGCKDCLVVMDSENIIFEGDDNIAPLYRETFDNPSFNPRWKSGIANIVTILNIDNQEWIEKQEI